MLFFKNICGKLFFTEPFHQPFHVLRVRGLAGRRDRVDFQGGPEGRGVCASLQSGGKYKI